MKRTLVTLMTVLLLAAFVARAQNIAPATATQVQATQGYYFTTPISATAAVATVTTLTIPAPPGGLYNYVCSLALNASQNASATAATNAVTTSTNFNAFALKFSFPATVNGTYDWGTKWGEPSTGCVKSVSPGTATTFASPNQAQTAFTWYATYYQAP